jgi:ATP-dependent Clp protease ATP-binding subunit ClpA
MLPRRITVLEDELNERQFTDGAERVIRHLRERAHDRGMGRGGLTEATAGMLAVLAILRWERKVALAALETLGADLDRLARDLDHAIEVEARLAQEAGGPPRVTSLPSGQRVLVVDTDTPCRPLIEQAVGESRMRGRNYVGSEHVLLAAVRSACPRFRDVLDRHRVTYERVEQAVLDLLGSVDP